MKSIKRRKRTVNQRGDALKIRIEEDVLEGTGTEIMERLRLRTFDPTEFPDIESYIWHLRANFMRMTDRD